MMLANMIDHLLNVFSLGSLTFLGLLTFIIAWGVRLLKTNEGARKAATELAKAAAVWAAARWFKL